MIVQACKGGSCRNSVKLSEGVFDLTAFAAWNGESVVFLGNDATYENNLRDVLIESRGRYKDLVECSSHFAWETRADGKFEFVSREGALGYPAEHYLDKTPESFVIEGKDVADPLPFHAREPMKGVEIRMRRADGGEACLVTACVPRFDAAGEWLGARGVCQDVSEERQRAEDLRREQDRGRFLAEIVNTIRDEVDPKKILRRAAIATGHALGATLCCIYRRDLEGTIVHAADYGDGPLESIDSLVADLTESRWRNEVKLDGWHVLAEAARQRDDVVGAICVLRRSEGEPWTRDHRNLLAGVAGHLGIAIEQIANHEALTRLSRIDELTGLLNRRAFMAASERRIKAALRRKMPAVLLYTDLDNFKPVNDVHGHHQGDMVLKKWSEILVSNSRGNDLIARLGGDEFALWLEDADLKGADTKGTALLSAARQLEPFSASPEQPLSASVGIAVFEPSSGETLKQLIVRADAAMYVAKRAGKGRLAIAPPPGES